MTDGSRSPFGALGDMVDAIFSATKPPKSSQQLRSRTVDGVLYVRADDLADLLDEHVPTQLRLVIARLRTAIKKGKK